MKTVLTLKNDIEILSLSNPNMHHTELGVYLRYGSMYEPDKYNGIAHFYEHIIFRNLNKLYGGDFYRLLDLNCVNFNACTYKELIEINIKFLPCCSDFALDILEKIFSPIILTADEISAERNRVRAEIREHSTWDLDDLAIKTVWENTSLANSILGTRGTVSKIRKKQLSVAHCEIFSAKNIIVCLTGNVSDELLNNTKLVLEKQEISQNIPFRDNTAPVPKSFGNRSCKIVHHRSGDARMRLCFDLDCKEITRAERDLLYDVLFTGETCKFYQHLSEEKGLIYSFDAYLGDYRNIGCISVFIEYANADFLLLIKEIVKIFQEIKQGNFNLSCAKTNYTLGREFLLDNPHDLNWSLMFKSRFLGTEYAFEDTANVYDSITEEQIVNAARKIFTTKNLVAVIANKANEKDLQTAKNILSELDM